MKIIASLVLFLIKYWQVGALAGLALSIWYPIHKLQQENIDLKKDKSELSQRIEKYQYDVVIFKENEITLKRAITDQNGKIDELNKFAKEQEAKYKAELAAAEVRSLKSIQKANNILVSIPKSTDMCEAANILINEQLP